MSTPIVAASSSWLITPNVGLTVWTLVVFAICLFILSKYVFPRIRQALDDRRKTITDSMDAAERTRQEADKVLAEYRERLTEARQQAE
jgi:F-type H+-transporting ATPase subunit b